MAAAERDPRTRLTLSVSGRSIEAAGHTVPVRIPDAVREALLTGQWDATALLLDDFDAVRAVSARLPYVAGF